MADRKLLPGKFVWFEHVSRDPKKAQAFFGEVFGWKVSPHPMGAASYEMIAAGEAMIGGYAEPSRPDLPPHWIAYASVDDVDAAARKAAAAGGSVLEPPSDIPGIGRMARIADPQGAELCLIKSADGDEPDAPAPHGGWLWNELHTTDPTSALTFYSDVIGYTHRAMDMGPAGTYHILTASGDDRAGVSSHLLPDTPPHWLPYVCVDDPDTIVTRARVLGAAIPMSPHDIPGVGRFAILADPTGAILAIMKPAPRQSPG